MATGTARPKTQTARQGKGATPSPTMPSEEKKARYEELRALLARLRAPDGCPWDREQTHQSLRPHLIQEAYEVLAVLDAGDVIRLPEELGDLLFQVLLHTQLAEEAGGVTFTGGVAGPPA